MPVKYDFIRNFSEGLAGVALGGKWGFIDKKGKVVIPIKYEHVKDFSGGVAEIELNGGKGYVDKNGREHFKKRNEGK